PTAAVSGLTALTIKKKSASGLVAVAANDIVSGESATLELDPSVTFWTLTNPQTSSASGGGFQITTVYKFAGTSGTYVMGSADFSSSTTQMSEIALDNTATANSTFTTPVTSPGVNNCVDVANGSSGFSVTVLGNTGFTIDGAASIVLGKATSFVMCLDATAANYRTATRKVINGLDLTNALTATETGAANAYVVTVTNPPASGLTTNIFGYFIPAHNNTGASTLNWCGLGNKAITKCGTTALASGDMLTTVMAHVDYDGTEFQLLNPQAIPCG